MNNEMFHEEKVVNKLFSISIVILMILASFTVFVGTVTAKAPTQSNENPSDKSVNIDIIQSIVSVEIADPEGDLMNWTIQGQYVTNNDSNDVSNGTVSANLITPLPYGTEIVWYVNVTDGYDWTNATYNFTTRNQFVPGFPVGFSAIAVGTDEIDLSWSLGSDADRTYIEWNSSSGWDLGEGNFLYNDTGLSTSHTDLDAHTTYYYQAWGWNETDYIFSSSYVADDDTTFNTPPSYGTPNPTNGSTGQPLTFTWSIPISDGDGDTFNWGIECSNGQSNSGSGDSDGTKELDISGLDYNTLYMVWVNATDGYDSVSEWYVFTTRGAFIPSVPVGFSAIDVGTDEIDLSWTLGTNSDKTYIEWNSSSSWNLGEGTELYNDSGTSTSHTDLDAHTTYYYQAWSWNETDKMFSSSYAAADDTTWNTPPSFGTPSLGNGSTGVDLSLTWSISVSDDDGDSFDWSIECSNGDVNSSSGDVDGVKELDISGLDYDTLYTVWVNATDGFDTTRAWYVFTTRGAFEPGVPTGFTATAAGADEIDLSWTLGIDSDKTYIEWNSSSGWILGEGSFLYNDTGNGTSHGGLDAHTTYYYQAWGWNETDEIYSSSYAADDDTTWNTPLSFGTPSPSNGSTGIDLSLTWSISVSDGDGDSFDWDIDCSNGQSNGSMGDSDGLKELDISGLDYDTLYTVWVNATDGFDTTRAWYVFTTRGAFEPGVPTGFTATAAGADEIDLSWVMGIDSDKTYIEWNSSSGWILGEGSFLYNDTGNSTSHTGLTPGTTYYYLAWSYNVTDNVFSSGSVGANNSTSTNSPPSIGDEDPADGSINIDTNYATVSVTITDPDGDLFDLTIQGTYVDNKGWFGASDGIKSANLTIPLPFNTEIVWYVNATDEYSSINETYQFTTRTQYGVDPPSIFTTTAYNMTQINLTWTKGNNSDYTYIRWDTDYYPTDRNDGNLSCNITETSYSQGGLPNNTTIYFRAWGYNVTDNVYSTSTAEAYSTTWATPYASDVEITPDPAYSDNDLICTYTYSSAKQGNSIYVWNVNDNPVVSGNTNTYYEYNVHNIDLSFDNPESIREADVDGDGDIDVLGAASSGDEIVWWENTDGEGTSWTKHQIKDNFNTAIDIYTIDMDGDSDIDVLGAAQFARDIVWWENDNGDGESWTEHPVDLNYPNAYSVYAADLDGDSDLDVIASCYSSNKVTWWENIDGLGINWTKNDIANLNYAASVFAADIDGDGDNDVLGVAGREVDDLIWWENNGTGGGWTQHTINDNFDGANSVYAADIDGDADYDIFSSALTADDIVWWENNGTGGGWINHTIDDNFDNPQEIDVKDLDGDNDLDVVSISDASVGGICWWENIDGYGTNWTKHIVINSWENGKAVCAADINGNGIVDIIGGATMIVDDVKWWETIQRGNTTLENSNFYGDDIVRCEITPMNIRGDSGLMMYDEIIISKSAPVQSGEVPTNQSTNIKPIPGLYVTCTDADDDIMSATWWSNSSGAWVQFAVDTSISSGTNITQTNSNFSDYSTTYWWSVNLTDGYKWANMTYSFTTNGAPSQSGESPANGSVNVDVTPSLYIVCSDMDNDLMTVYWRSNSSDSWATFAVDSSISSGTNISQINSNFSEYNTTYWWSVNLTDGYNWANATYYFTTRSKYMPNPPSGFTASATGTSTISLSWTKDSKADTTWIQRKTGGYPTSISDGTNVYKDSGISKTDSGLNPSTNYYYAAWSWNITGSLWSTTASKDSAKTQKDNGGGGDGGIPPTNILPTADANGPYSGYVHTIIQFDGSGSTDSDGTITSFSWDYGDGATGTGMISNHTYTTAGNYDIKLTVTDNGGLSNTDTTTAAIEEKPTEDNPPEISDVVRTPTKVTSKDNVNISADVTDDIGLSSVILYWDDGSENTITMDYSHGDTYSALIGPFSEGNTISYWVKATDTNNQNSTSSSYSFTVYAPAILEEIGNITEEGKEVVIEGSYINHINIKPTKQLQNVNITIENVTEVEIFAINYAGDGVVFKYFNITITANDTYVEDEDIDSLTIKFKVETIWINSENIDKEKVSLLRYHNNIWEMLNTSYLSEDDNYVYYETVMLGLSTFAIVGTKIILKEEPTSFLEINYVYIILAIIAIVILIIVILFKTGYLYIEVEVEELKPEKKATKKKGVKPRKKTSAKKSKSKT